MNKTLSRLTVGLLLTSLAPNIVLGATGDIYNMRNSMLYTQYDTNSFKSDLKSGKVSEDDLWIEQADGLLKKYKDIKQAERQALLNVLNKYQIDISNPKLLEEAITTYSSEIASETKLLVDSVSTQSKPENPIYPEGSQKLASADITSRLSDDKKSVEFVVNETLDVDGSPYAKDVTVKVTGKLEGNTVGYFRTGKGKVNKFRYVPDTYNFEVMEVKDSPVVTSVECKIDSEPVNWVLSPEFSDALVTIDGNPTDGYSVKYLIDVVEKYEVNGQVILRPVDVSGSQLIIRGDSMPDQAITVNGSSGIGKLSSLPTITPKFELKKNADRLVTGDIPTGTYIPSNMFTFSKVQHTNSRKRSVISLGSISTELTDLTVNILYNGQSVASKVVNAATPYFDIDLTEGEYNYTVYSGELLVGDGTFTVSYPLPDGLATNPQSLNIDTTETVQVFIKYKEERQPGEPFTIEFKNDITQDKIVKTVKDGESVILPISGPMQTYTMTLLKDAVPTGTVGTHYVTIADLINTNFQGLSGYAVKDDSAGTTDYCVDVPIEGKYPNIWTAFNELYETKLTTYQNDIKIGEEIIQITSPLTIKIDKRADMHSYIDFSLYFTNKKNGVTFGKKFYANPFPQDITLSEPITPVVPVEPQVPDVPSTPDEKLDFEEVQTGTTTLEFVETKENQNSDSNSNSETNSEELDYISTGEMWVPSKDEDDEMVATFDTIDD